MSNQRHAIVLMVLVGLGQASVSCGKSARPATKTDAGADTRDGTATIDRAPATLLEAVADIVIPNCAIGGCHDSTAVTHGMDLTTADKIHTNWVNKGGFDHCTGLSVPRVIPGDVEGSLVVIKVTGVAVCPLSERMPLPPRPALSTEQIQVIRAWIAAGAPSDRPPSDAGGDDGPGTENDSGLPGCTSTQACQPEQTCAGDRCSGPWECQLHFVDDTLEHPCSTNVIPFCGCDGVTFEASETCPDRPWQHAGACNDGVNCNYNSVSCADPQPTCPEGQVPSVVKECWGPCVPITQCRCLYHWMCPERDRYTCIVAEAQYRCGLQPPSPDGGVDAEDDASATDGP